MLKPGRRKPGFFRPFGKPQVDISIVGQKIREWTSFRVENNAFSAADSFEIKLPWDVTEKPVDPLLSSSPDHHSIITTSPAVPVEVSLGFNVSGKPEGEPRHLMKGKMDVARWNFSSTGEYVTLIGRDLTGPLIDARTTEKFQNMTSSQVAVKLFNRHGLKPQATATKTAIGTYLNNNQAHLAEESSEWDILLFLAQQEGFVVRVLGGTGYFGPLAEIANLKADPIVFTWGQNIIELEIERGQMARKKIEVEVISWHNGQRIVEKAGVRKEVEEKVVQRFMIPGLTRQQAKQRASGILIELTQQEWFGTIRTDWVPELSIDRRISLHGVGKGLSQVFYVVRASVENNLDRGIEVELAFVSNPLGPQGG